MYALLQGFVISDWAALDKLCDPPGSNNCFCILSAINAGIDMVNIEVFFFGKNIEV